MAADSLAVTYANILQATRRIKGIARHTPVMTSRQANARVNAEVFFKCENLQRAGAFKFRGAYNALSCLTEEQKRRGVIAFSSGNHAQAVALAAKLLGMQATIVMPHDAPAIKLAATRAYGAEIVLYQRSKEDREVLAARLIEQSGSIMIPPFDHPDIIAGQGTAAKELIEEVGPLDFLFVCVGGGGLISGCSIAAKHLCPDCKVFGVEPVTGNDAQQSLRRGEIVKIDVPDTIADGAQTQAIGKLVFPIIQSNVSDILTVTDNQLRAQMKFFAERMKIIVEPTGCLAAAAVMQLGVDVSEKRVGVIVSGGNVDLSQMAVLCTH